MRLSPHVVTHIEARTGGSTPGKDKQSTVCWGRIHDGAETTAVFSFTVNLISIEEKTSHP